MRRGDGATPAPVPGPVPTQEPQRQRRLLLQTATETPAAAQSAADPQPAASRHNTLNGYMVLRVYELEAAVPPCDPENAKWGIRPRTSRHDNSASGWAQRERFRSALAQHGRVSDVKRLSRSGSEFRM